MREVKPPSNDYAGGEVVMTSYQELTAEGESSPLFTGCCRAKEVINRDLDGKTHPEPGDEDGKLEFELSARYPRYLTVYNSLTLGTSLDSPPSATLEHSGGLLNTGLPPLIPCPLAAQGAGAGLSRT